MNQITPRSHSAVASLAAVLADPRLAAEVAVYTGPQRWSSGALTSPSAWMVLLAALAVMAGHAYPVFLRFQGGKAVASFVGAFLCLAPAAIAVESVVFVAVVVWTRHISMGSIVGAAVFPLAVWLMLQPPAPVEIASVVAAAFIIYRHSSNIQRLRAGTESRFRFGAGKP